MRQLSVAATPSKNGNGTGRESTTRDSLARESIANTGLPLSPANSTSAGSDFLPPNNTSPYGIEDPMRTVRVVNAVSTNVVNKNVEGGEGRQSEERSDSGRPNHLLT
jgi:hypothetical protein